MKTKEAGKPAPKMAPSARLERATYCSASKRSNPLSYEGIMPQLLFVGGCGTSEAGF